MTLVLATQYHDSIPLEVEGVTPDITRDKTLTEIEKLQVFQGNRQGVLADFFSVSGDPSDARIQWQGNLSSVHWIGAGMTAGQITIEGSAGRHVGSRMRAGQIDVLGDVSDWVGAEMLGGMIHVRGNAAHLVGAGYRGSARGMSGGTLLVQGNAGNEVGHTMRRGFVAIGGNIGDLAGMNMLAGSLLVFGRGGIRHGAGMRRGTIALLGDESPARDLPEQGQASHGSFTPLPTFRYAYRGQLEILRVIERSLATHDFPCPFPLSKTVIDLYNGDLLEGGRGELLLRAA